MNPTTATYGGDTTHTGSSGTTTVAVIATRSTSTGVSCTPPSVVVGQPTTCTATVADTDVGTKSTPTGTVSFSSSGAGTFSSTSCTLLGRGTSASCSVSYTPIAFGTGPHTIPATFFCNTTPTAETGTLTLHVTLPSSSTGVSCTPPTVVVGQATTCTATVADTDVGTKSAPTGTVGFSSSGSGTFSPMS